MDDISCDKVTILVCVNGDSMEICNCLLRLNIGYHFVQNRWYRNYSILIVVTFGVNAPIYHSLFHCLEGRKFEFEIGVIIFNIK